MLSSMRSPGIWVMTARHPRLRDRQTDRRASHRSRAGCVRSPVDYVAARLFEDPHAFVQNLRCGRYGIAIDERDHGRLCIAFDVLAASV